MEAYKTNAPFLMHKPDHDALQRLISGKGGQADADAYMKYSHANVASGLFMIEDASRDVAFLRERNPHLSWPEIAHVVLTGKSRP